MPRMPKYLKEEWAFFLDDRGRRKYRFVGLISPVEFGETRLYHFGGVTNPTAKRAARKRSDKKMEERIRLVQEEAANSPVVQFESPKNADLPEREVENGSP